MRLYDQIFNVVKKFKELFSPGPVTNADVSGSITAEIFIIVSIVIMPTCSRDSWPWPRRWQLPARS